MSQVTLTLINASASFLRLSGVKSLKAKFDWIPSYLMAEVTERTKSRYWGRTNCSWSQFVQRANPTCPYGVLPIFLAHSLCTKSGQKQHCYFQHIFLSNIIILSEGIRFLIFQDQYWSCKSINLLFKNNWILSVCSLLLALLKVTLTSSAHFIFLMQSKPQFHRFLNIIDPTVRLWNYF